MINFSQNGLSMSQAQSLSNICNQRCVEIEKKLNKINNASKRITFNGKEYIDTVGNKIPENIIYLIIEKGRLSATQAFLVEAIKDKNNKTKEIVSRKFDLVKYEEENPIGKTQNVEYPTLIQNVTEDFGWESLTAKEYAEYLEAEAYASHIGQFIHKNGKLSILRDELQTMKRLEWMEVEAGKKIPVEIDVHHTPEGLIELHEKLAAKHREWEQRVNYFKSKVKNLTTMENARISKENSKMLDVYNIELSSANNLYNSKKAEYNGLLQKAMKDFDEKTQLELKDFVSLRIVVDPRFQPVIDEIMKTTEVDKEAAEA